MRLSPSSEGEAPSRSDSSSGKLRAAPEDRGSVDFAVVQADYGRSSGFLSLAVATMMSGMPLSAIPICQMSFSTTAAISSMGHMVLGC